MFFNKYKTCFDEKNDKKNNNLCISSPVKHEKVNCPAGFVYCMSDEYNDVDICTKDISACSEINQNHTKISSDFDYALENQDHLLLFVTLERLKSFIESLDSCQS